MNRLNVNDRVKIWGNIFKEDQLLLMKKSEDVIQVSLYEGSHGGGECNEEISLNVTIFEWNM